MIQIIASLDLDGYRESSVCGQAGWSGLGDTVSSILCVYYRPSDRQVRGEINGVVQEAAGTYDDGSGSGEHCVGGVGGVHERWPGVGIAKLRV